MPEDENVNRYDSATPVEMDEAATPMIEDDPVVPISDKYGDNTESTADVDNTSTPLPADNEDGDGASTIKSIDVLQYTLGDLKEYLHGIQDGIDIVLKVIEEKEEE
jgi:hypothetical protein